MIFGIGEWIAERWAPANLIFEEWANFIDMSLVVLVAVVLAIFVIYRFLYYRSVKLETWDVVFALRRPWFITLVAVPVVQIILSLLVSLGTLSGFSSSAFVGTLLLSLLEGFFGMIAYWVLSVVSYPARGKYFPFFSYRH